MQNPDSIQASEQPSRSLRVWSKQTNDSETWSVHRKAGTISEQWCFMRMRSSFPFECWPWLTVPSCHEFYGMRRIGLTIKVPPIEAVDWCVHLWRLLGGIFLHSDVSCSRILMTIILYRLQKGACAVSCSSVIASEAFVLSTGFAVHQ